MLVSKIKPCVSPYGRSGRLALRLPESWLVPKLLPALLTSPDVQGCLLEARADFVPPSSVLSLPVLSFPSKPQLLTPTPTPTRTNPAQTLSFLKAQFLKVDTTAVAKGQAGQNHGERATAVTSRRVGQRRVGGAPVGPCRSLTENRGTLHLLALLPSYSPSTLPFLI